MGENSASLSISATAMKTFSQKLQEFIAPSTVTTRLTSCAQVRGNGPLSAVRFFWGRFESRRQKRRKQTDNSTFAWCMIHLSLFLRATLCAWTGTFAAASLFFGDDSGKCTI